jgi:hypothetical protein
MGLSTQVLKYSNRGCQTKQIGKPPPLPAPPADYFQGQLQCYFFTNFVLLFTKTNWENFGNFIF